MSTKNYRGRNSRFASGFTILELCVVVLISMVAAAVAIPGYISVNSYLRMAGDIRDLNGLVALAKMRAAQDYTHARVRANLNAGTFQLEYWDKNANCWKTDGDTVNRCTLGGTTTVQYLSQGVSFGYGTVGATSPNPQSTIGQAPACTTGAAGSAPGNNMQNTACIEFNSRGLPVSSNGSPTANDAFYITNSNTVNGVTVIVSGLIQVWTTPASSTAWAAR